MEPDQSAPAGAVSSVSTLFVQDTGVKSFVTVTVVDTAGNGTNE